MTYVQSSGTDEVKTNHPSQGDPVGFWPSKNLIQPMLSHVKHSDEELVLPKPFVKREVKAE